MTVHHIQQSDDQILVDKLYKLEEAAELLSLKTPQKVREFIHSGQLPYVDLNPSGERPQWRVRASHINALIDSLTLKEAA